MHQEFLDYIKEENKILVLCSQPLDLDSLCSGLVLKKYLESLGKSVTLTFPRNFSETEKNNFAWLANFSEIEDGDTRKYFSSPQFDVVVFIDGTSLTQYYDSDAGKSNPPDLSLYQKRVHIDHHLKLSDPLGKLIIHDSKIGSTMEVLLTDIIPMDFFNDQTATLAYAGMAGDTGNFQYAFTAKTLKLAGQLLEGGADANLIVQKMFNEKPKRYFDTYSWVISQVEFNSDIQTTFLKLPLKLIKEQKLTKDLVDLAKDIYKEEIAKSTVGYDRGVVIEEKSTGRVKVSARGNNNNRISFPEVFIEIEGAKGGGHFNAAGFEIEGKTVDQVQAEIVRVFAEILKSV